MFFSPPVRSVPFERVIHFVDTTMSRVTWPEYTLRTLLGIKKSAIICALQARPTQVDPPSPPFQSVYMIVCV